MTRLLEPFEILKKQLRILIPLLVAVPVIMYYYWIIQYSVNCPQLDDFAVLLISEKLLHCNSISEFSDYLFSFHNEHRIVVTRLFFVGLALLNKGVINLKWAIIVGNLTLMGLLSLYYKSFQKLNISTWYLLPIPFLLFQMQFFENSFFAMASIQNLGIWLWAGLSFWLLSKEENGEIPVKYFVAGCCAACIAMLTSGNGLFVFPSSVVLLLLVRAKKQLIVWLVISALACWLYMKGLSNQQHLDLSKVIEGTLGYLGAFAGASTFRLLPALLGGVISIVVLIINSNLIPFVNTPIKPHSKRVQLFLGSFFLFMILTALAISIHRDLASVISTPRYKIGSAITLITVYLMVLNTQIPSTLRMTSGLLGIVFSIAFCMFTYIKMTPIVKEDKQMLLATEQAFYQKTKGVNVPEIAFEKEWLSILKAGVWQFSTEKK